MNPTQHQEVFPSELKTELRGWNGKAFERRTVFTQDLATGKWVLFACAMWPLDEGAPMPDQRVDYGTTVLVSDWIAAADLRVFLLDLKGKLADVLGEPLKSEFWPSCERQHVTLRNYWMDRPGVVYTWKVKEQPNPPTTPMLKLQAPYYPDVHEAAKDWLRLRQFSGHSDGRKGSVMLMLPETRASIQKHSWSEDDEHLSLEIEGEAVHSGNVCVKGAFWRGTDITQLHEPVLQGRVTLRIPRDVTRLELHLMGADGGVFEYHKEYIDFAGDKRFLGSRHRMSTDRVTQALKAGEGPQIEFKPFVAIPQQNGSLNSSQRAKLDEVLESVAAFSNADGGTIFIGVTNDVRVAGFKADFVKWKGKLATKELVDDYARELRAHIRDEMYLPVDIDISASELQNEFLVLVEVPASLPRYVSLKKDPRLLRRHGASNRSVPPEEWTPRERDVFGNFR